MDYHIWFQCYPKREIAGRTYRTINPHQVKVGTLKKTLKPCHVKTLYKNYSSTRHHWCVSNISTIGIARSERRLPFSERFFCSLILKIKKSSSKRLFKIWWFMTLKRKKRKWNSPSWEVSFDSSAYAWLVCDYILRFSKLFS
jgi:hypothetical protein